MKKLSELLPSVRLHPTSDDLANKPKPERRNCEICKTPMLSNPGWFNGWKYPNIHAECGDIWDLFCQRPPKSFWETVEDPKPKQFFCPRCMSERTIEPRMSHGRVSYEGKCECGESWTNLYRIKRRCDLCKSVYFVNEKTASMVCVPCEVAKRRGQTTPKKSASKSDEEY